MNVLWVQFGSRLDGCSSANSGDVVGVAEEAPVAEAFQRCGVGGGAPFYRIHSRNGGEVGGKAALSNWFILINQSQLLNLSVNKSWT